VNRTGDKNESNELSDGYDMPTMDLSTARNGTETSKQSDFEFEVTESVEAAPQSLASRLIGKTFGEYTIEAPLGRGGMGLVFRARHRMMDRLVALKLLPTDSAADRELVDRFFLEIKSLGKLLHPNIVTAFDAGQVDGLHFMVMELIEGQSLAQLISSQGPCSIEQTLKIVRQIGSALAYAHDRGLIHRDIKPSNVMITPDGVIKILDFGLVRLMTLDNDSKTADQTRRLMGTVEFMSPEQIRNTSSIDHRSDLYSLGATMYYLLTGTTIYVGEPVAIAIAHLNEPPPLLFELRPDIDLRIDSLFQKLVAKSPDERFENAHRMLHYIDENRLLQRLYATGTSTVSIARELGKKLLEYPTRNVGKQSTTRRELGAIGIELGMAQSQAASFDIATKRFVSTKFRDDQETIENFLWSKNERVLIGADAASARAQEPAFAFHSLQRWLGFQKIDREFCGRQCPPEVILAAFIHHVGQFSSAHVKNLSHAVVTIPSSYDQLRRIAVLNACRIAGLDVLQLLDKHLAASLARIATSRNGNAVVPNFQLQGPSTIGAVGDQVLHQIVIMFTGSSCEAAIVRVESKRSQTLATAGDWQMGLLRWQARLAEFFVAEIYQKSKRPVRDDVVLAARVQRLVERTVPLVFANGAAFAKLKVGNDSFEWHITIQQLLKLCNTELEAFDRYIRTALERSKVDINEIDEVLLIGESLRSPTFRSRRRELFGRDIAESYIEPSDLARGAAIQATYLLPPGIEDCPHAKGVLPMDIGIALRVNKQFIHEPRVLLRRDTPTPTSHSRTLRLDRTYNDNLSMQFLEKTRLEDGEWTRLSSIKILKLIPQLQPNDPLLVRLKVDLSGIWSATLMDQNRGQQLEVPPLASYSLDEEQIQTWRQWLETALLCSL
jgi:eukaryotic-like serine/threonine-protein kinase